MPTLIRAAERPDGPRRTMKFEGAAHGTGLSFFSVDIDPGRGVGLHFHPYDEIWLVLSGNVTFRTEEGEYPAEINDIMIVEAETPHGFTATGTTPLRMMCLHNSPQIIQTFLGPSES